MHESCEARCAQQDGGPGRSETITPDQQDRKKVRAKMPHCGQKAIFIASRTLVNQVSNRFEESENPTPVASKRTPWNKGKLTGAKPPLRPKHVWSIRTKLQMADRKRDLALFNLAIDSKLRGCDVIGLKVEDIAPNGYAIERATIRQKKTGRSVRFEVTEQTRQAVDDYLRAANRKRGDFLFAAQRQADRGLSTRQYARLVADWIHGIGLDPCLFGTHSLRRTKATMIYRRTGNLRLSSCSLAIPRSRARFAILVSRLMTLWR
jgi:integrase